MSVMCCRYVTFAFFHFSVTGFAPGIRKDYRCIWVSSRDQHKDRQRIAVNEFGVPTDCVVMDKQSGKDFDCPGYRHLVRKLKLDNTLLKWATENVSRCWKSVVKKCTFISNVSKIFSLDIRMYSNNKRQ